MSRNLIAYEYVFYEPFGRQSTVVMAYPQGRQHSKVLVLKKVFSLHNTYTDNKCSPYYLQLFFPFYS